MGSALRRKVFDTDVNVRDKERGWMRHKESRDGGGLDSDPNNKRKYAPFFSFSLCL